MRRIKRTVRRSKKKLPGFKGVREVREFFDAFRWYVKTRLYRVFSGFEKIKDVIVDTLYRRRGKYARPFVHTGMMGMLFSMVTIGPMVLSGEVFSSDLERGALPSSMVLGATTMDYMYEVGTLQGEDVKRFRGGEIIDYVIQSGDTVSGIAEKFGISEETILWANDMEEDDKIKVGQSLKILPVTGVMHTVKRGETIYSIAKKYGLEDAAEAQGILNYPFNTFLDDEKFTLAVGQKLVVPDGVIPKKTYEPRPTYARITTPDAGVVSATGRFVWPASGRISQGYRFYHKAIDIANKAGGPILAADSGKVMVAGWPDNYGYGNRVVIDHGNGYKTLYAHMSRIRVVSGQSVNRGDVIGDMGSTGRSTGTHLHFEIRKGSFLDNPMNYLQ